MTATGHFDGPASGARSSAQPADIRRRNLSVIMRVVRTHGPVARAEIARLTGLGAASATKLTSLLVDAALLRERPSPVETRQPGRPPVPLVVDDRQHRVIGVHIGLRRTAVGTVDLTGRVVERTSVSHRDLSFDAIVRQVASAIRTMRQEDASGAAALGVGASVGGWFDSATGHVVEHAALGWNNVPLRAALEHELDLPVRVDSNVRAIALAEAWTGHAAGLRSLLHVFVGNVVGAGLLIDGALHRGPGSASGYLDHLPVGVDTNRRCHCGRHDCLQAVASDTATVAQARASGVLRDDGELWDLVTLARAGDQGAVSLLRDRARQVGAAIALLIEILNPERVIVGGGVVDDPLFLSDLQAATAERLHRPSKTDVGELVRPTSFGRRAVMLASAILFLDAFYQSPMGFLPIQTSGKGDR